MKKQLLIAGGSGMIGTALTEEALRLDWDVTILSRHPGKDKIIWDPSSGTIDFEGQMNFDAIVNLAGENISEKRWTEKRKKEIYQSRIDACATLEKYLMKGQLTTPFYLGVSGSGIHGNNGSKIINEETKIDHQDDWFVKTCLDWESAHKRIEALGIRTVILRLGIVLSRKGGALKEILSTPGFPVLSFFGSGKQVWPWIHNHDVARMIFFCILNSQVSGLFLGASPGPASNKKFTKTVNQFISPKRIVVGVPKFIVSIILGKMHRVLFDSCNASSEKIQRAGFAFNFPGIEEALRDLLK
jgi:uncharacterized protein (TIGR01777 family)